MENRIWEYCIFERLRFSSDAGAMDENKDPILGVYNIQYCANNGTVIAKTVHRVTPNNADPVKSPFGMILGLLGGAGWELISIAETQDRVDCCTINTAYLKRPILQGRGVDEPKIEYFV